MRLFISYRRDDSPAIAGRIRDRLVKQFGPKNVYYDVDSNLPGKDFRQQIDSSVQACDVVVVVIGPHWLEVKAGQRRIDDAGDYVRLEVEAALQRDITVVPALVNGVGVPSARDLPESIQSLSYRHGLQVRHDPDFHGDMTRLINSLIAGNAPPWRRHWKSASAVVTLLVVAGLAIWLILPWTGYTSRDADGPGRSTNSAQASIPATTAPTSSLLSTANRTFAVRGEVSLTTDPSALEADGDNLLVLSKSGILQRIDPRTSDIKSSVNFDYPGFDLVSNPIEIAVSLYDDGRVGFVDRAFGSSELIEIPGGHPFNGAMAADGFWFTCQTAHSGFLLHVSGRKEVGRIPVNFFPSGLWVEGDNLYVTASGQGLVGKVDAKTGDVQTVAVGSFPVDLAIIGGDLWVTLAESDEVVVLDADNLTIKARHSVGDRPWKMAVGLGSVWVTNNTETSNTPGSVSRLDPVNGQRQQPDIVVGFTPDQIAAGDRSIYVQSRGRVTILDAEAG